MPRPLSPRLRRHFKERRALADPELRAALRPIEDWEVSGEEAPLGHVRLGLTPERKARAQQDPP